jgi:hypothetical protein
MDVARYRERYQAELAKAAKSMEESAAAPLEAQDLKQQVEALLATLRDPAAAVADRTAALEELAALDFLGPRFAPFRAA